MTVNVPLLRKTLEHITEHPDEWNQEQWAVQNGCGTAFCLAGHAVAMSGAEMAWGDPDPDTGIVEADLTTAGVRVMVAAGDLLGIDVNPFGIYGAPLFAPNNTLRDLYRISNDLTDGEIPIPDVLPDGS